MYLCKNYLGCSGKNIERYSTDQNLGFDICNDCGIIWRSADSINLSKAYEEDYFSSKKYDKKRKHKVNKSGWLIDLARIFNPKLTSLLEIGCSIGYTLEAAKRRDINHLGIDISKYAVDYCKNLGLNAEQSGLDQLIREGKHFDMLFMQHVLEHFEDTFSTLKNCHDLLNDQGLILIMVPNSNYKRAVKLKSKHRFYSLKGVGSEHYAYFNYENIERVLNASGFKVLQKDYPLFIRQYDSFKFIVNRLFRRLLSTCNSDQEMLVIAEKVS